MDWVQNLMTLFSCEFIGDCCQDDEEFVEHILFTLSEMTFL